MRGLTRRWIIRDDAAAPASHASATPQLPGLTPLVLRVLASRGLVDADQIVRFCEPKLTNLHDPALLPGIDAAVTRLIDAVRRDQLIVIYGDYDVDGITATAILYHTIKAVQPAARIRTYVPHRLDEGYGLNSDALRQLKAEGADLVITVDCGISAVGPVNTARELGLDLIITDHHAIPDFASSPKPQAPSLPAALAIVHPRLPGSDYPFGDLCGAGVAFKIAWRFATMWCNSQRVSESLQKTLINMLPLAALGTIADVVPLVGENRVIAAFGLRGIKQTPLDGLKALIEASNLTDAKIDSEKVGFVLGPRLNACGRMGHAAEAVKMLTDASYDEALAIARRLTEFNEHRQGVERKIFDDACRMAEDAGQTGDDCRIIVLAHESWHPGVVGIVCSRMAERFGRPAILLHRNRDVCKGSARSIDGYSIHEAISTASHLLTTFGGHEAAAGLTLPSANLQAFAETLTAHAFERIAADQLVPSIHIDCDATLDELDLSAAHRLHALGPFGRGNRSPTLRLRNMTVLDPPKQMGGQGRHLAMRFRQEGVRGQNWIRAVWWGAGERAGDFAPGMRVDLAIEPRINEWNGRQTVEAEIKDVHLLERERVEVHIAAACDEIAVAESA